MTSSQVEMRLRIQILQFTKFLLVETNSPIQQVFTCLKLHFFPNFIYSCIAVGFLQLFLYLHMLVCLDVIGLNTIVSVTYNKQFGKDIHNMVKTPIW